MKPDRILFLPDVQKIYPASRTTIYRSIRAGSFPQQVACSLGRVGWRESDVMEWLRTLKKPEKKLATQLPIGTN